MELGEYLAVLRKRWLVIALLALIGGALGYGLAATETPLYRSTASVYLTTNRGDTVSELAQGASYASSLVQSYVVLATSSMVLEPVVEDLGLTTSAKRLAGSVSVDSPLNTYLIDITASDPNPEKAATVAKAIARQLSKAVTELAPKASDGSSALRMELVANATPASAPYSPRTKLDTAVGLLAGAGLGVLLALIMAQLDTRIRTADDLPRVPSRTTLGQIPHDPTRAKRPRSLIELPHSPLAEAYRRLRTNLQFVDASRPLGAFVVTSSLAGEGKSTTAVNLALVMAEKGATVLLVDADLRSPSIATICGLEDSAGLSAVLIHEADVDDVIQPWQLPGLHVIAAGQVPPNPSQLIDSRSMAEFLNLAKERYDVVILDTAPLLAVTDAAILARRTDGALVVARSRKVRRPELAEALAGLDTAGAPVLGVLLNAVQGGRADVRYGYGHPRRRGPFHRVAAPKTARISHGRREAPATRSGWSALDDAAGTRPEAQAADSRGDATDRPAWPRIDDHDSSGRHAPEVGSEGDDGTAAGARDLPAPTQRRSHAEGERAEDDDRAAPGGEPDVHDGDQTEADGADDHQRSDAVAAQSRGVAEE